jgi:hypothetical protein
MRRSGGTIMSSNKIINALKQGVVTVVFEKIDTKEIRTMPCTLNQDIHKQSIDIKKYDTNSDTIIMYALDKKAWRDVRVNTIKEWYTGYPKET